MCLARIRIGIFVKFLILPYEKSVNGAFFSNNRVGHSFEPGHISGPANFSENDAIIILCIFSNVENCDTTK